MTSFARSGSTLRTQYSLGLLALVAVIPLGCSNMTSPSTQSVTSTSQVRIKGRVHGGNQPVSGATVTVYYAGQSGYGSAGTTGTSTTTANDGYGSFSFSVSCPSSPNDPLVYLVATGGNTLNNGSSGNNSAAQFLAAVAPCSLINSIANIISACINNNANGDATACTTLKNDATPPAAARTSQPNGTFGPATDILTSVYYMLTNPTNGSSANLNAIYALAPGTGAPYQPTLTSAPTDWTIGITYSSISNCTNGDGFFDVPYDLKLDVSGNVWIANGPNTNGNLAQMRFDGTPLVCTAVAGKSRGSTIDDQGNIWVGSFSFRGMLATSSALRRTRTRWTCWGRPVTVMRIPPASRRAAAA